MPSGMDYDANLDTKGLLCPLPVLKLRKTLLGLPPGGTVELLATDRQAWDDVAEFCRETGDTLVERRDDTGTLVFRVTRATSAMSS